jgi:hypothetical protein
MKLKLVKPEKLMALNDAKLHNKQILKIYFRIFQKNKGKILPYCPVIKKEIAIPEIIKKNPKKYNENLKKFLDNHQEIEYIVLDGNHKTTAATLAKRKIPIMVIEKDEDFKILKELQKKGEIFGFHNIPSSINSELKSLNTSLRDYYSPKLGFNSVMEKTKKLAKTKQIPDYMKDCFFRKK